MNRMMTSMLLLGIAGLLMAASDLSAQINYSFFEGTGDPVEGKFSDLEFNIYTGTPNSKLSFESRVLDLGFTFSYEGNDYDQITVYNTGVILFGGKEALDDANSNGLSSYDLPIIAPFWDQMYVSDDFGGSCESSYVLAGQLNSKAGAMFVVDYHNIGLGRGDQKGRSTVNFQVRFHEGSNKIEFWYGDLTGAPDDCTGGRGGMQTSASIGLANGGSFLSVTPEQPATSSISKSNDEIDITTTSISYGTLYTFCPAGLIGDEKQGGTAGMQDGDTLLIGFDPVLLGSSQDFIPFTHFNNCAGSYYYSIEGTSADEYAISPSEGKLAGEWSTPTLTFTPTGQGPRYATLVVQDDGGINRTFVLAAEGTPRTIWFGSVAEGGTPDVLDGDTFFEEIKVPNNTSASFQPLTIQVSDVKGPDMEVTFTIIDATGTFSVDPLSATVSPGSSISPVITLAPVRRVGWQEATLIVTADGETRTYLLRYFSSGVGAEFFIDGEPVKAGNALFRNTYECIGVGTKTIAIEVRSIGDEAFVISSDKALLTETIIGPGTPPYRLLRDDNGDLMPARDYYVSDAAGNPLPMPITIAPQATETIYLTFTPMRNGSRRARAFFETNGGNFMGLDVNTTPSLGMLNFELVGHGMTGTLSNEEGTGLPKPMVFAPTEVRGTATMTGMIRNNGQCDLAIDGDDFRIVSGDVADFKIVEMFPGFTPDNTGKYHIAPGDTATYTVSFTPSRSGSRLASIRVVSGDSAIYFGGLTERGTYQIDLYGTGKVGLEARPVRLGPAVIDGPNASGTAIIENNFGGEVTILNLRIVGSTEILEDPSRPWPATPILVEGGTKVNLGLLFTPDAGSNPGIRTAQIEATLSNGHILLVDISALAGTRSLAIVPTALFQGTKVALGNMARTYLAVSNEGTLPVRIASMTIGGAGATDYRISPLVRSTIEPGTTEFFEVAYTPSLIGASPATIQIETNATNGAPAGTFTVTLGGEGTSTTMEGGGDPSGSTATPGSDPANRRSLEMVTMTAGTALGQSLPNPTSGRVAIPYTLPAQQQVTIALYDMSGRMVRLLVDGVIGEGSHEIAADLSDLPSGRYFYMLRTVDGTLSQTIDLVR